MQEAVARSSVPLVPSPPPFSLNETCELCVRVLLRHKAVLLAHVARHSASHAGVQARAVCHALRVVPVSGQRQLPVSINVAQGEKRGRRDSFEPLEMLICKVERRKCGVQLGYRDDGVVVCIEKVLYALENKVVYV